MRRHRASSGARERAARRRGACLKPAPVSLGTCCALCELPHFRLPADLAPPKACFGFPSSGKHNSVFSPLSRNWAWDKNSGKRGRGAAPRGALTRRSCVRGQLRPWRCSALALPFAVRCRMVGRACGYGLSGPDGLKGHRGNHENQCNSALGHFLFAAISLKRQNNCATWGLKPGPWAKIGPACLARRDGARCTTPGPPRPPSFEYAGMMPA